MDPQPPAQKNTKENQGDGVVIEPLRTYEQDVRNVVASQNISVVKMALAERQRQGGQEESGEAASPQSKRNILILSISLILIVGSIAAIGGTYYFLSYAKNSLLSQSTAPAFIATDSTLTINLTSTTKTELSQKITAEQSSLPNGLIERVFFHSQSAPATSTLSTTDLLNILQTKAPASLIRSLYPEFAFGFYGKDRVPFLILETNSYDQAYAGMLQWEPYMRSEFENILFSTVLENQLPISTSTDATANTSVTTVAVATTTSTTAAAPTTVGSSVSSVPFPVSFKDLVVANKDTRAIDNRAGQLLILYGFVDKRYIVITRDEDALNEIYNRLRQNELSR